MSESKVLILVDSDVIIHLFKADKISLLNELYPKRIRIIDIVLSELLKNPTTRGIIENLFLYRQVEEVILPPNLYDEFISLKSRMKGPGERAILVFCKNNNHIIASSNTSDIGPFCEENNMCYLTTLDIFNIAIERKLMTETEVDLCISKITKNNESYVCCKTIGDHRKFHFNKEKLLY